MVLSVGILYHWNLLLGEGKLYSARRFRAVLSNAEEVEVDAEDVKFELWF